MEKRQIRYEYMRACGRFLSFAFFYYILSPSTHGPFYTARARAAKEIRKEKVTKGYTKGLSIVSLRPK